MGDQVDDPLRLLEVPAEPAVLAVGHVVEVASARLPDESAGDDAALHDGLRVGADRIRRPRSCPSRASTCPACPHTRTRGPEGSHAHPGGSGQRQQCDERSQKGPRSM